MFKYLWKTETRGEFFALVSAFCVVIIWATGISDFPIIREIWEFLNKCGVHNCSGITISVSIVGTIIVVLTLVVAIISSNKRDIQNQEQIERMNGQVQILIQKNRLKTLKDYLISFLINTLRYEEEISHKGLKILEAERGVILQWHTLEEKKLVDYRFIIFFRLYSKIDDDVDEILKNEHWYAGIGTGIIDIIRLKDGSYVMSGFSDRDEQYFPIEKVFHDMSEIDYDAIILTILLLIMDEKDDFQKHNDTHNMYSAKQQKQSKKG